MADARELRDVLRQEVLYSRQSSSTLKSCIFSGSIGVLAAVFAFRLLQITNPVPAVSKDDDPLFQPFGL